MALRKLEPGGLLLQGLPRPCICNSVFFSSQKASQWSGVGPYESGSICAVGPGTQIEGEGNGKLPIRL